VSVERHAALVDVSACVLYSACVLSVWCGMREAERETSRQ